MNEQEFWEEVEDKVWPKVLHELNSMQSLCLRRLADPTITVDISGVRRIQGELQAYKTIANLPRRILNAIASDRTKEGL